MRYNEIKEGLKVTIGNRGNEIWEVIEPIQLSFDDEADEELNDFEKARVYCEREDNGELLFIPIKMLRHAPTCPKCSTTLKFIQSKKGQFLGCRNHPKCSHYKPVRYTGDYTLSETLFEGEAWNH